MTTSRHVKAYIGLGSNLDNPVSQVLQALAELDELPQTTCVGRSSLYVSKPLGQAAQADYINAVAVIRTLLSAHSLLAELHVIEAKHDRKRGPERWGPRTLDLDLLLFGDEQLTTSRLVIPHPGLPRREFVLYPLYEIAPQLEIPGQQALHELVSRCPRRGMQRLEETYESRSS